MKFDIREQSEYKLLVTTYSQDKLKYKDVYAEFDKQYKEYKINRKVNFRHIEIKAKYGKCISNQFNILLKNY